MSTPFPHAVIPTLATTAFDTGNSQPATIPTTKDDMISVASVPVTYQELTKSEISDLAEVFATPDRKQSRALIVDLPVHLKCTIPLLSSFCKHHKKINSLAMISLFKAIKSDVQQEMSKYWLPLNLANLLSETIVDQIHYVYNNQFLVPCHCAGCNLEAMCRDVKFMVAAGAMLLAGTNPKDWKVSNRIFWMEACLRVKVSKEQQHPILESMYALGLEMRKVREEHKDALKKPGTEPRPYMRKYATLAKTSGEKRLASEEHFGSCIRIPHHIMPMSKQSTTEVPAKIVSAQKQCAREPVPNAPGGLNLGHDRVANGTQNVLRNEEIRNANDTGEAVSAEDQVARGIPDERDSQPTTEHHRRSSGPSIISQLEYDIRTMIESEHEVDTDVSRANSSVFSGQTSKTLVERYRTHNSLKGFHLHTLPVFSTRPASSIYSDHSQEDRLEKYRTEFHYSDFEFEPPAPLFSEYLSKALATAVRARPGHLPTPTVTPSPEISPNSKTPSQRPDNSKPTKTAHKTAMKTDPLLDVIFERYKLEYWPPLQTTRAAIRGSPVKGIHRSSYTAEVIEPEEDKYQGGSRGD